ncbi:amino acid adenylation domain-containing protein [Mucilaginibacter sp. 21P]|uniref:non-ribosomal peptide synthetase n=1 Tax=Mucilaginibacter sp. 21P TaxID=2778902 RepID=UPI001C5597D0|nr:amino acid adenylation domain-containing protein [Mucilaginibacter sp. 21P]QXV63876.1 amino acid adenylation domain-containing protein [Mucilaginibacter sp. 21P]
METSTSGYNLSSLQKQSWENYQRGYTCNNLLTIDISGEINNDALRRALQGIVNRHEIFRTSYIEQPHLSYPLQVVNDEATVLFDYEDTAACPSVNQCGAAACAAKKIQQTVATQKFDLRAGASLGAKLVKLAPQRYILVLSVSPLAGDVETLLNVYSELSINYNNIYGSDEEAFQYIQFSEWQNDIIEDEDVEAIDYWKQKQDAFAPNNALPIETFNPELLDKPAGVLNADIPAGITGKLYSYTKERNITPGDFLSMCWSVLLWHHLDKPEALTIGIAESSRNFEAFRSINGLMTKTLPLQLKISHGVTADSLISEIKAQVKENRLYSDNLGVHNQQKINYRFLFEYYQSGKAVYQAPADVRFKVSAIYSGLPDAQLKLSVIDYDNELDIQINYSAANFTAHAVQLLSNQLLNIVDAVLTQPVQGLGQLFKVSQKEKESIFNKFNNTTAAFPAEPYIKLFEAQAKKTPFKLAVEFNSERLTYAALDRKANQVAAFLTVNYNVAGKIVAVCQKRSADLIVHLLGIMKAGAAFLPIESTSPAERVSFLLSDSQAVLCIADELLKIEHNIPVVVSREISTSIKNKSSEPLDLSINPADTLYVIYTSGSTGAPKGTLISNRSFVNYISWFVTSYAITEKDSTLLFSSIAFDLSYTSLWSALVSGASLHIMEEGVILEPNKFIATLIDNQITYIKLTPSHFNLITDDPTADNSIPAAALRLIVIGGEKIRVKDVQKYISLKRSTQFVNHYGPTETTVGVVATTIDTQCFEKFIQTPVIGRPVSNNKVFILLTGNELAPIGITGELCVSGSGLAKGYLNRGDLESEKFIDNPFEPGTRLYKTGDLARWLPDGAIQLLGRNDSQIKIRGYRVELGEIEKSLNEEDSIQNAVVLPFCDRAEDMYLKAFLLKSKAKVDIAAIKEKLSKSLPEYMVPSQFIALDTFPLFANGKINRKEFYNIKAMEIERELNFEMPANATEQFVAAIWQQILVKDEVSTNENFFNIGGNSLKLVKVFRALSKAYPNNLTLADLFKYTTIKAVSSYLDSVDKLAKSASDTEIENLESFDF